MQNNSRKFMVGLLSVVAVVIVFAAVIKIAFRQGVSSIVTTSGDVSVSKFSDGQQRVASQSGGYMFSVPSGWRVEPTGGMNVAVYPSAVLPGQTLRTASSSSECKIELSVFANASGTPLSTWLEGYLREDPTAEITETSAEARTVAGAVAIEWHGLMNGIQSDLIYAANGGHMYEIAPSSLDPADISSVPCAPYVNTFLDSLHFSSSS